MIVEILVTAHIGVVAGEVPAADKLRASVCEAIDNAVALGARTGFEHPFSQTTSIAVESVKLAGREPGDGAADVFLSWVEAAENIPAGAIWIPRIVYDRRDNGWYWRDAASDDDWSGPHAERDGAARAACEKNNFVPQVAGN